jgi:hypothetical protein
MVPPFDIFKVADDGIPLWIETAATLDAAKARVQELSEFWPAEYVIASRKTGHKISITPEGGS